MNDSNLLQLVLLFGSLSLVSFGGGNAIIPEMHRQSVGVQHWMTDRQFADLFAIAQAAPGPSSLIVGLIGLKAAGVVGSLVATVAMLGPSCALIWIATRLWGRFQGSRWHIAFERGMAPVAVGLIFATGLTIIRASDKTPLAFAITAVATVLLWRTRVNPLLVMAGAGVLGLLWIP